MSKTSRTAQVEGPLKDLPEPAYVEPEGTARRPKFAGPISGIASAPPETSTEGVPGSANASIDAGDQSRGRADSSDGEKKS